MMNKEHAAAYALELAQGHRTNCRESPSPDRPAAWPRRADSEAAERLDDGLRAWLQGHRRDRRVESRRPRRAGCSGIWSRDALRQTSVAIPAHRRRRPAHSGWLLHFQQHARLQVAHTPAWRLRLRGYRHPGSRNIPMICSVVNIFRAIPSSPSNGLKMAGFA